MNYLLDTNTVTYLMEGRAAITSKVRVLVGWLSFLFRPSPSPNCATVCGSCPKAAKRRDPWQASRAYSIPAWIYDRSPPAEVYSEAGATLKNAGISFSFQDLAIASIAIAENKILASNDGFFEHMQRLCGLRFELREP